MNTKLKVLSVLGVLGALSLASASSYAGLIDAWNLDLSKLNGKVLSNLAVIGGATDTLAVDHLNVVGMSVISQTVVGGVAKGNPFTEKGSLQLNTATPEGGGGTSNLNFGTGLDGFIQFVGLAGTLNLDGTVTFTPGSGTVKLWVEDDNDLDSATGGVLELVKYNIDAPSGGSNLDFFGGANANATVDITAHVISVGVAGLFEKGGTDLTTLTLHLVNTGSLLVSIDNSGVLPNPVTGSGTSVITVQNNGQYNLMPEPGSLFLSGLALTVAGLITRRKRANGS